MAANDKSKERLSKELSAGITKFMEQALDYSQVACPTADTFKVLRSKILRVGNDCIRDAKKKLQHYEVEFVPQTEEVIEVRTPQIIKK